MRVAGVRLSASRSPVQASARVANRCGVPATLSVHGQGIRRLGEGLAPLAAATLLLDLVGPIVTQRALQAASETHVTRED